LVDTKVGRQSAHPNVCEPEQFVTVPAGGASIAEMAMDGTAK
jgi:hypothetical protein